MPRKVGENIPFGICQPVGFAQEFLGLTIKQAMDEIDAVGEIPQCRPVFRSRAGRGRRFVWLLPLSSGLLKNVCGCFFHGNVNSVFDTFKLMAPVVLDKRVDTRLFWGLANVRLTFGAEQARRLCIYLYISEFSVEAWAVHCIIGAVPRGGVHGLRNRQIRGSGR